MIIVDSFTSKSEFCVIRRYEDLVRIFKKNPAIYGISDMKIRDLNPLNDEIFYNIVYYAKEFGIDENLTVRQFILKIYKIFSKPKKLNIEELKLESKEDKIERERIERERKFMAREIRHILDEEKTSMDCLTGLLRRNKIIVEIKNEVNNFNRNIEREIESTFCVVIIDIDNFKTINDKYGHNVGDKVIAGVGEILKTSLRKTDISSRWGGDEFLILLKRTDSEEGLLVCEKLRKEIEEELVKTLNEKYNISINTPVTCTFGVCDFVKIGSIGCEDKNGSIGCEKIIGNADLALYNSKNSGKNRVSCY